VSAARLKALSARIVLEEGTASRFLAERSVVIDCVVGAVVQQVYSGAETYCRDNTLKCYTFSRLDQSAFGGWAPPGPAGGAYGAPLTH